MFSVRSTIVASLALLSAVECASAQVRIETVPVGSAGNPPDKTGFGHVGYEYRIGRLEVTNLQYARFLNAVAAEGDPYGLYDAEMTRHERGGIIREGEGRPLFPFRYEPKPGREHEPVNFVSFYDAARFVNWLNNLQYDGSTEWGAYPILRGGPDAGDLGPRSNTAAWVVPNENEWYKAAYHDATRPERYWLLPTRSNVVPASPDDQLTTEQIPSAFYTMHQAGGVREWTETDNAANQKWIRGGCRERYEDARSSEHSSRPAAWQDEHTGFRVLCLHAPALAADFLDAGLHANDAPLWLVFAMLPAHSDVLSELMGDRHGFTGQAGQPPQPSDTPVSHAVTHLSDASSHKEVLDWHWESALAEGQERQPTPITQETPKDPPPSPPERRRPDPTPDGDPPEETPEPSTLLLMAAAGFAACLRRRR